jgi:hypothetical protein
MRKKVKFDNEIHEIRIYNHAGFKHLNLISAIINKVEDVNVIPYVELILINDKAIFTSYSNLVPGTNYLNCIDLLSATTNNPVLLNESFQTLKCVLADNICDAGVEIEMEFEVE